MRSLLRPSAYICLALPLAFGVIRAAQTGTDFRYLATALASFGAVISVIGRAGATAVPQGRVLIGLAASTLVGAATAFALGARSIPAVGVVAFAFAACQVAGWVGLRWTR